MRLAGYRYGCTRLLFARTTHKMTGGECIGGPLALTVGQRTALENAGDEAVSAKLKMVDDAPSFIIQFSGAHITRQDVESWVAERKAANRPKQSYVRRTIHQWAAKGWRRAGLGGGARK